MDWTLLPTEIRVKIYLLYNTIRLHTVISACYTIQNGWRKFWAPKIIAKKLIVHEIVRIYGNGVVINFTRGSIPPRDMAYLFGDINNNEFVNIIKYCVKVLSGNEDVGFWIKIITALDHRIYRDLSYENSYPLPYTKYYDQINHSHQLLSMRFRGTYCGTF